MAIGVRISIVRSDLRPDGRGQINRRSRRFQRAQVPDLHTAGPMVNDDEVHPSRQLAEAFIGLQRSGQASKRTIETADLLAVHALLGVAEGSGSQAAHLDNDERLWRTGFDGKDVDLVPADLEVAHDNVPAQCDEVCGRGFLAGGAAYLPLRPHGTPR